MTYRNDDMTGAKLVGTAVTGYISIDGLRSESGGKDCTVEKVRVRMVASSFKNHAS